MNKLAKIFLIVSISFFSLIILLILVGKLSFGYGLGDVFYLIYLILWLGIQIAIFLLIKKNIINVEIVIIVFICFALCISIYFTIRKLTIDRGFENRWNGKIFIESFKEHERKESEQVSCEIKKYDSIINLNPSDYKTITEKGILLRHNGYTKEAIIEFEKAQKINNNYFDAYDECGMVYSQIQNYNKAVSNYENALRIDTANQQVKDII